MRLPQLVLTRAVAAGVVVMSTLLTTPGRAAAQEPVGARAFCLPGGTGRCFAFAITDAASGFDLWLRNLSPQADADLDPFGVRDFSIRRVNASAPGGLRTDLSSGFGNANVVTTGGALRGPSGLNEDTGTLEFPAVRRFTYTAFGSFGLLGCSWPTPERLDAVGYVGVTCAERGLDGWLRIAFGARVLTEGPLLAPPTARPATNADVAVQVAGCVTHLGAASGVTGVVPGSTWCASAPYAGSVVPEPAGVWLVGAGVVGGWAAARRRQFV